MDVPRADRSGPSSARDPHPSDEDLSLGTPDRGSPIHILSSYGRCTTLVTCYCRFEGNT